MISHAMAKLGKQGRAVAKDSIECSAREVNGTVQHGKGTEPLGAAELRSGTAQNCLAPQ